MKKLSLICIMMLLASSAFAQTNWFNGTFEEAKSKAQEDDKLVMLFFTGGTT